MELAEVERWWIDGRGGRVEIPYVALVLLAFARVGERIALDGPGGFRESTGSDTYTTPRCTGRGVGRGELIGVGCLRHDTPR
jgi:hypothetical protein